MTKSLGSRIRMDPKIMRGKPVIRGTTIPVETIVRMLASGATRTEILAKYPDLKADDIDATLAFGLTALEMDDEGPLEG